MSYPYNPEVINYEKEEQREGYPYNEEDKYYSSYYDYSNNIVIKEIKTPYDIHLNQKKKKKSFFYYFKKTLKILFCPFLCCFFCCIY